MIIVASSGYAFKDNEYPVFFPGDFDSELVNSIIPYIEENFKVKKRKKQPCCGRTFTWFRTGYGYSGKTPGAFFQQLEYFQVLQYIS